MNFVKEKIKDFYLLDSKIENIFINEYMPAAPGDYVKVFIYGFMYAEHCLPMDNSTIAKQLKLTEKDVQDAWSYWESMGAIKRRYDDFHEDMGYYVEFINLKELLYGKSAAAEAPEPEPVDFSNSLGSTSVKDMFADIERILGRTMSSTEVTQGLSWLQDFGASKELIVCAVQYCSERNKTSFKYIGKVISEWVKAGLNTVEQVNDYLQELDERYYRYRRVLKALGFTRNATETEKEMMDSWFDEMGYSMDRVLDACTKTAGISSPNFNYVNKVLENWKNDADKKGDDINKKVNITQSEVKQDYDYLRKKAETEAEERRKEVYKALPRIREIDDYVAKSSYELSKALIMGNAEAEAKRIRNEMDELAEERAILLTENNYEMDYTDIKYMCDKGNDTGITDLGERCSCIKLRTEEAEVWVKQGNLKK